MELRELFGRLQAIGIDTTSPKVMNVLESEQLLNIPFVDIFSSIWAVIAEYYIQGREVKQGDFYDAPLLSLAIPYCNIVTTDRVMKEILTNRLKFNQKFDTLILSASEVDKSELQRIVRGLINN